MSNNVDVAVADIEKPLTWKEENPVLVAFLRRFGLRPQPRNYTPPKNVEFDVKLPTLDAPLHPRFR